ncbi:hypothetical protein Pmar_PMAR025137 [Perkinsus marinus ATCC 50983]|uniref:PX domain-containing protein n=1 Tax=Perkinsus marinus (strain ATCC 50983 / TXsc) TaxID=423536 RepID=C5LQJ2_PERM5|nr:hypothetical protein Pmar_PMAR025137 [Perkinsus marinus ATCC 50983]EER01038.1 hypothetical protein Pmar_PMAR025137 [Perkinsus marinus ATCC 50983]|eukprot:XP_002768320.1 hypothetical protein Pmar_PMAR025137 [Perkinsus marinus ATCC 50983]
MSTAASLGSSRVGVALCGEDDVADCVVELGLLMIPYYMFLVMVPLRIHELYSCARSLPPRRWPFTNLVKRVCCASLAVANVGIATAAVVFYDRIYGSCYVVLTYETLVSFVVPASVLVEFTVLLVPHGYYKLRPSGMALRVITREDSNVAGQLYPSSGSQAMIEHTIDSGYSPPSIGSPSAPLPAFRPCLKLLDVQVVAKIGPTGQALTEYKLFTRVYPQAGEAFQITVKRRFKVLKWLDDRLRVLFDHDRFPEFHAKMGSFPPREVVEANPFTRQVGFREYFRTLYTSQMFMVPELLDIVGLNPMKGSKQLSAFMSLSASQLRMEEKARMSMRGRGSVSLDLPTGGEQRFASSAASSSNRLEARGSPLTGVLESRHRYVQFVRPARAIISTRSRGRIDVLPWCGDQGHGVCGGTSRAWTKEFIAANADFLQVRLMVSLPAKMRMPGVNRAAFLEQRREQLEHFLRGLLTDPAVCHCLLLWDFLNVPREELIHLLDPLWGNGAAEALGPGRPMSPPVSPRRFSGSWDPRRVSNYATLRGNAMLGRNSFDRMSPSPLTSLTLPRDTSLNGLFGMSAPQSMGVLPETVEEGPEVELESNRQRTAEVVLYHYDVDCLPVAHPKTLFVLKLFRPADDSPYGEEWVIQRRYSEFRELHQVLQSHFVHDARARKILNDLVFPTKVLSHRADLEKAQNEERKEMLGLWIAGIMSSIDVLGCPAMEDFTKRDDSAAAGLQGSALAAQ